jgi:hypothetical protein
MVILYCAWLYVVLGQVDARGPSSLSAHPEFCPAEVQQTRGSLLHNSRSGGKQQALADPSSCWAMQA